MRPFVRMSVGTIRLCLAGVVLAWAMACTGSPRDGGTPDAAVAVASRARPRVVVVGDSLTAGLGVRTDEAFPAVLQRRLTAAGSPFEVVNAGVSGDTTAGGLRRVDWALDGDVRIVVLALGANDGLRGVPVEEMQRNLSAIIERAQGRGASVLLAGMEAPPNFGPLYVTAYRNVFRDLARQYRLPFVPFLLEGVAGVPSLNQADGIHPSPEGARMVADHLWQTLKPMVETVAAR